MLKLLEIKQCQFGAEKPLLNPFDFSLVSGEVVALLGENGVGKSTFMNLCVGNTKLHSGEIFLGKQNQLDLSYRELFRKISLVRSHLQIPERILVKDFVSLGLESRNFERVKSALEKTETLEFLNRPLITLSDGERSRVLLAEALVRNTSLLLLDEPTAFLDVPHSLALFKLLKRIAQEENKGVLISTHQVEHALRYADRLLVFLKNGNVYSGKKEELLNKGVLSWAEIS